MWKTAKEIRNLFKITSQTLYNWRKQGKIKFKVINSRKILYKIDENNLDKRKNVIYCRVSNTKQKDDLLRQENLLKDYCVKNGIKVDLVFSEIASGMNENRPKLQDLFKLIAQGEISTVFVNYKDRLTRFGFGYFNYLFNLFGTNIEVVNATTETSFENELVTDLISIIHHFSMKMYSHRRTKFKKLFKELEDENN